MPRFNPTKLTVLECKRCGYKWVSRKLDGKPPVRCPKCKTDRWDKPVVKKDQSRKMLKWHARRRVGNLPQKPQKTPP